jgi:hypothetical protein
MESGSWLHVSRFSSIFEEKVLFITSQCITFDFFPLVYLAYILLFCKTNQAFIKAHFTPRTFLGQFMYTTVPYSLISILSEKEGHCHLQADTCVSLDMCMFYCSKIHISDVKTIANRLRIIYFYSRMYDINTFNLHLCHFVALITIILIICI